MRIKRTFTVIEKDFQKFREICKKEEIPFSFVLGELIKDYNKKKEVEND